MKIAEIREAINTLDWNRSDLYGATRDEFKRMDVATRLNKHIAICEALEIKPRFARDIEDCASALKRAKEMVERWKRLQDPQEPTTFEAKSERTLKVYTYEIKLSEQPELTEHLNEKFGQACWSAKILWNGEETRTVEITVAVAGKPKLMRIK